MATRSRKRAHGEGTLSRRKDGRWEGKLLVSGKRLSVYGATQAEARRKLDALKLAVGTGVNVSAGRQTVASWAAYWIDEIAPVTASPGTLERYAWTMRVHWLPLLGHRPLADVTLLDLQSAIADMTRRGFSPSTVRTYLAVIRAAFMSAVRARVIPYSPAAGIRLPRVTPAQRPHAWTAGEVSRFLAHARESGDPYTPVYSIMLGAGLRPSEALALRWCDVDLDAGTITVARTARRVGGTVIVKEPKTPRSRRTVPMAGHTRQDLAAYMADRPRPVDPSALLFPGRLPQPTDLATMRARFTATLLEAGLPKITLHELRDTYVTLALGAGVPPHIVMAAVGHASLVQTLDYGHPTLADARAIPAALDRLSSDDNSEDGGGGTITEVG